MITGFTIHYADGTEKKCETYEIYKHLVFSLFEKSELDEIDYLFAPQYFGVLPKPDMRIINSQFNFEKYAVTQYEDNRDWCKSVFCGFESCNFEWIKVVYKGQTRVYINVVEKEPLFYTRVLHLRWDHANQDLIVDSLERPRSIEIV